MRTVLKVVSLLCNIIGGFLILSIPFVGIFKVFSLFPAWFYIVVFLGVVIPYIVRENEIDEAIKDSQQTDKSLTNKNLQINTNSEKEQNHNEVKVDNDIFDTEIEYHVEEYLRMNSEKISLGSRTYPVKIVSHKNLPNSPLVAPFYDAKGNWKVDEEGKPLGYVRLEQRIQTLVDNHISFETRVALIKGDIGELLSRINMHQLKDGSQLGGKIVIIESLEPKWEGHEPEVDKTGRKRGFKFYNSFYPVYREYTYTEDATKGDELVTEEQARIFANSNFIIADDLPF